MTKGSTDADGTAGVPTEAIKVIDPQVVKKLPQGTIVRTVTSHGSSLWTRTARLDAEINGNPVRYFLKTAHGDRARRLMHAEFTSMTAIHSIVPTLVPQVIAWGSYETVDNVHFLLCEFREMRDGLPDLNKFPSLVAQLHRNSASPNGKFGFEMATFHGQTAIDHGWSDTWEEYFARTTRVLFVKEQDVRGHNEEMAKLSRPFFDEVIPRLLTPLNTGTVKIKPALIHGDLWHGNAATDAASGEPIIFDAASFYAHNEYELAVWRQPWNEIGEAYREEYCKHFAPSYPQEDFEDRGMLYATRVNILDSILYTKDEEYRKLAVLSMKNLVEKFSGGPKE